jgi:hypothetical protein
VKRWLGTIAVLGICMVFLSSIAVPIDDPETPYNESETPVNLATPVVINTASVVPHASRLISLFRIQSVSWNDGATKCALTSRRGALLSNSRLKRLFTLLC